MAKHRLCIGVDIGTSSVKVCQLREAGKELRLVTYAERPLPADTLVDGAIMNAGNVVEELLALFAQHKIREKRVALALSGHSVIIKNIVMPPMGRDELEASVQLEAEQYIPFAIKDVFFDVQSLGPASSDPEQLDVLLVAAKKDYVNEYTAVLHEAGLEPVVCDVDAFALETAFARNYTLDPHISVALVHIGAAKTSINILAGGKSRFTRDLGLGGYSLTQEIQRQTQAPFDEAERIKLMAPQTLTPQASEALTQALHQLTDEIVHTCEYFAAAHPFPMPHRIYLSGHSAKVHGLVQLLASKTQATCEIMDPFRRILPGGMHPLQLGGVGPGASVAVGLGMRYVGDC